MKNKVLELLKTRGSIHLLELQKLMPEIKGEYAMYMPAKEGFNPNVLWINGVSKEFIGLFNELLINDKQIDWNPVSFLDLLTSGSPMYGNIPLATIRRVKGGKKDCWMPIKIQLNKNK